MEQTVELSVFSMSSRLCGVTVKTRVRGTRWSLNIFQKKWGTKANLWNTFWTTAFRMQDEWARWERLGQWPAFDKSSCPAHMLTGLQGGWIPRSKTTGTMMMEESPWGVLAFTVSPTKTGGLMTMGIRHHCIYICMCISLQKVPYLCLIGKVVFLRCASNGTQGHTPVVHDQEIESVESTGPQELSL